MARSIVSADGIVARGRAMAHLLAGSWRAAPPALEMDASTLRDVTPQVTAVGAASLAWWKIVRSGLRDAPEAAELRQAYRWDALRSELHLRAIQEVVPRLRAAGIEPIVIKGWSTARLYPRASLRSFTDLDLVVPPGLGARAEASLQTGSPLSCQDHPDILDGSTWAAADWNGEGPRGDLADHPWGAVMERSRLVRLEDVSVRVLGSEDQLRLAAVHAVRHCFSRPTWLCDIGLLMETLPEGFDWAYCLAGRRRHTQRVVLSLGLAHTVLGADITRSPADAGHVPAWLVGAVLRRWGTPASNGPGPSIVRALFRPRTLPSELYRRWPDPLAATLRLNLPLTGNSPLAVQALDFVWQFGVMGTLRRLRHSVRSVTG